MKFTRFFLLLIVPSILSSCAFGTRKVELTYPAQENSSGQAFAQVSATAATSASRKIVLVPFMGQTDLSLIGHVQNGFTMKTARVIATNDVSQWITDAIQLELEKHGYQVSQKSAAEAKSGEWVVSGDIITVYCTAYWNYEGEVTFTARVEKDGQKLLEKPYVGNEHSGTNWAARGKSFGNVLTIALQKAIQPLLIDIENLRTSDVSAADQQADTGKA